MADVCKSKKIPIRIGVNGGSLDKKLLEKYGHPTPEALVESAFSHLELLEQAGFYDACVSIKSSSVPTMVAACAGCFRRRCDYPLHIGVTETGPVRAGPHRRPWASGPCCWDGIETPCGCLTADPVQEVYAAKEILRAAGVRKDGVNIISCPTCGRTSIDLIGLVDQVEQALQDCSKSITVAVMGCVVNGPGEAREANGHRRWRDCGVLFVKGEPVQLPYGSHCPPCWTRSTAVTTYMMEKSNEALPLAICE